MLKKHHFVSICVLVLFLFSLGASPLLVGQAVKQPSIFQTDVLELGDPWSFLWMESTNDHFEAVAWTIGAIFVAGYSQDAGAALDSERNVLLVKFDSEGDQLWHQIWETPYDEAAFALASSVDALYLAGQTTSGVNATNGLLVKLDFNGNQLWNVSWGIDLDEWFTAVAIGSDGVYVTGVVVKTGYNDADTVTVKFGFDGAQIWNSTWDMADVDRGSAIIVGSDSVYIVGDYGTQWNGTSNNSFLTKYSLTGIQMWNRTWGGPENDQGRGVALDNENIYVTGSTESYSVHGSAELFLLNYNTSGQLLWTQTDQTGENHSGYAVAAADETIYIGGEYETSTQGFQSSLLLYNATSELIQKLHWGGAGCCRPKALTTSIDSQFIAGTTSGWLTDTNNGFLVKFGPNGTSAPGPIEIQSISNIDPFGSYSLLWTEAMDPDGHIIGYELEMDTTPFFEWPDVTWTTNETSQQITFNQEGTFYFRVRARDNDDLFGPWSNMKAVNVTTITPLPFNPWLAPTILVIGALLICAMILVLYIRRWRVETF